ncbi:MAG: SDR family NAD(P)-dependent oxidoreductase [Actinomycetes bacterium]
MPTADLTGTALVTGASRGIGEALAAALAARGHDLVLVARDTAAMDGLAARLGSAHGVVVEVLTADLGAPDDVDAVCARLADPDRPVDLLVNNAGFGSFGPFVELDRATEVAMVDVNVRAVVALSHAAATTMAARGRGAIVNVASVLGFQPGPNVATYAAGKAFVRSFSEALHEELREAGVLVTVLCPGLTRTAIFDATDADVSGIPDWLWSTPEDVARTCLEDLDRGRATSVPGLPNRLLTTASPRLPGPVVRRVGRALARVL